LKPSTPNFLVPALVSETRSSSFCLVLPARPIAAPKHSRISGSVAPSRKELGLGCRILR